MAAIATDGKGNYRTLNAAGDWVPTPPPGTKPSQTGLEGYPEEAAQAEYAKSFPQPAPRPAFPPAPAPNPASGGLGDPGTLSGAVAEGFRTGPRIIGQPAIDQAERTSLGYFVTSPLLQGVNLPLRLGNAALKGGQATIESLLTPFNQILGTNFARDIAAMPEAFPTGVPEEATYSGRGTTLLRPPSAPSPRQQFVGERTAPPRAPGMTDAERIQQLVEHAVNDEQPSVGPPMARGPLTEEAPSAQPQPPPPPPASGAAGAPPQQPTATAQPAGAQITPATELGMTPREEAAYRSTAEGNKLLEPQEPGVRDDKQYLPGEIVNEAEASQDVQVARELKSLRQQTPSLDAKMTADENHNNNLRANAITNALPGQVQITAAKTARKDAMKAAEPKVFGNATDADVAPITQKIQEILDEPGNRQNTQLQQYVRPLLDRLQNPDGTPKIVDPKELWGFRKDVQHLTSGAAQLADPNLGRVSGILGDVLNTIDDRIEAAAPGYKAQLRNDYRTRSREIDAMEALNAERFKLFDTQNKPNYNALQGLMRRIADTRQANDPYEPFTHVSQDTLDKLWNIRDSMRRTQAADRLAAPRGSPTSQNFGDALRAAGRMAVQNAGPVVGGTLGSLLPIPGVGPALGIVAGTAVNHFLSERAMAQRLTRGLELTNPNRMMPPPP